MEQSIYILLSTAYVKEVTVPGGSNIISSLSACLSLVGVSDSIQYD